MHMFKASEKQLEHKKCAGTEFLKHMISYRKKRKFENLWYLFNFLSVNFQD